jgi:hypothetical protein
MALQNGGGKLPGKTQYSGRRRSVTRRSGFKSHQDSTGGEYRVDDVESVVLKAGDRLKVLFEFPAIPPGALAGFGCWFCATGKVDVVVTDNPAQVAVTEYPAKIAKTTYPYPNWNKLGGLWHVSEGWTGRCITVIFVARTDGEFALYEPQCGLVKHQHLNDARPVLLRNIHECSPESNFIETAGRVIVDGPKARGKPIPLVRKSCNRCARFLPINVANERSSLSFSNHCVAEHRRPCQHRGFGILRPVQPGRDELRLEHGFQLECRYCKKFEVNAAHNPKRTVAQMKEDAARRRAFELLIEALMEGSEQLAYRLKTGRELSDEILRRFRYTCFKCSKSLEAGWHLDHTRPLALLWPLDQTATALCRDCNSAKRDRPPGEFYTPNEIKRLALMVGLSEAELRNPAPNRGIVNLLLQKRDWFFDEFLTSSEMTKEREGKTAAELLVKALDKVLAAAGSRVRLTDELERRRGRRR